MKKNIIQIIIAAFDMNYIIKIQIFNNKLSFVLTISILYIYIINYKYVS